MTAFVPQHHQHQTGPQSIAAATTLFDAAAHSSGNKNWCTGGRVPVEKRHIPYNNSTKSLRNNNRSIIILQRRRQARLAAEQNLTTEHCSTTGGRVPVEKRLQRRRQARLEAEQATSISDVVVYNEQSVVVCEVKGIVLDEEHEHEHHQESIVTYSSPSIPASMIPSPPNKVDIDTNSKNDVVAFSSSSYHANYFLNLGRMLWLSLRHQQIDSNRHIIHYDAIDSTSTSTSSSALAPMNHHRNHHHCRIVKRDTNPPTPTPSSISGETLFDITLFNFGLSRELPTMTLTNADTQRQWQRQRQTRLEDNVESIHNHLFRLVAWILWALSSRYNTRRYTGGRNEAEVVQRQVVLRCDTVY